MITFSFYRPSNSNGDCDGSGRKSVYYAVECFHRRFEREFHEFTGDYVKQRGDDTPMPQPGYTLFPVRQLKLIDTMHRVKLVLASNFEKS